MAASERIDELVAQARELIEEISREGRGAVEEAERAADENVRRFGELKDELSSLRSESQVLEDELDAMPVRHSKAVLEDDVEAELALKDRYGDSKERLAEIGKRIPEVEAELRILSPRGEADREVMIEQYAAVNRAAAGPLVELRRISKEISDAAEREAGHFEGVIEERRGESWSWQQDLSWTPENRERLRRSGNLPEEDRTKVVRADPAKLARGGPGAG